MCWSITPPARQCSGASAVVDLPKLSSNRVGNCSDCAKYASADLARLSPDSGVMP